LETKAGSKEISYLTFRDGAVFLKNQLVTKSMCRVLISLVKKSMVWPERTDGMGCVRQTRSVAGAPFRCGMFIVTSGSCCGLRNPDAQA